MPQFHIVERQLTGTGVIRGGGGHKQRLIPAGTTIYCICWRSRFFWSAYLNKQQAIHTMNGLEETLLPTARRPLPLETLLAWNFSRLPPVRISRPPS